MRRVAIGAARGRETREQEGDLLGIEARAGRHQRRAAGIEQRPRQGLAGCQLGFGEQQDGTVFGHRDGTLDEMDSIRMTAR
ncbi:hypothetical protein [Burkholderia gladioli]|uniref:hypothetical protein n=1 Tax=Burkholderia gladioli TaxID=28095 RepID=UPI00163FFC78|nr:hypothetical protein [Burkholderia gladioli]